MQQVKRKSYCLLWPFISESVTTLSLMALIGYRIVEPFKEGGQRTTK